MKIQGFFSYIFGNFFYKISTLIRTMLQLRYLEASESSDIFFQSTRILSVFRRPIVSGTFQSLFSLYYEKHRKDGKEKEFSGFVVVYLFCFFLGVAVAVVMLFYVFVFLLDIKNTALFATNLIFFLPLIPGMFLIYVFKCISDLQGKFFFTSISFTMGSVCSILCILIFVHFKMYFLGFLFGSLIYCFSQVIYLFLLVGKSSFKFQSSFVDISFLKDFLKIQYEALIPVSEVVTGSIVSRMGKGAVSHIDYAHKCLQIIFSFVGDSLISVMSPVLSKSENFSQNVRNVLMITHVICTPIAFLLVFYGGQISMFLVKFVLLKKTAISHFQSFSEIVSILSLSFYFYIMNRIISSVLVFSKKLNKSLFGQILNAILNITFSILFFKYGKNGIVWASNLSLFIQFLLSSYHLFSLDNFFSSQDKFFFFLAPVSGVILGMPYVFQSNIGFLFIITVVILSCWKNLKQKSLFFLLLLPLYQILMYSNVFFFLCYFIFYISIFSEYINILF